MERSVEDVLKETQTALKNAEELLQKFRALIKELEETVRPKSPAGKP